MLEYEVQKPFLMFLGFLLMLKNHWSNIYSWIMVEFMHVKVMKKLKEVIVTSNYFSLTCDEVTTIDNVSWINVHAYMTID
jgi:hypothetical protein